MNALRQGFWSLKPSDDRQEDYEVKEVVDRRDATNDYPDTLRRLGAGESKDDAVDHQ